MFNNIDLCSVRIFVFRNLLNVLLPMALEMKWRVILTSFILHS